MKFVALFSLLFSLTAFANTSPVGKWKTIDDETKKEKSIVEITEANGTLSGKIVQLFKKPEEDQNPKCVKCKGDLKDQPILGMTILWNLKPNGEKWADGEIMDPNNGKTYSCKMSLIDGGNKLEVRGFLGFSLLGRTQVWERVTEVAPPVVVETPAVETPAPPVEKPKKKK